MELDNPFDRALAVRRPAPHVADALIRTNDTLQFAWDSARSVFGIDARPEHAVAICGLMLSELRRDAPA